MTSHEGSPALDPPDEAQAPSSFAGFRLPPSVRRASPLRRRAAALALDAILLWVVGMVFGTMLSGLWSQCPWLGQPFGLAIAVAYFGLLGSQDGGGQTIGKRLLRLRVVDATGAPPALPQALLRAFVLASPAVLNQMALPEPAPFANALLVAIVFGLGPVVLVVPLLNRKKGARGLHDLVAGTRVVAAVGAVEAPASPSPRLLRASVAWCGLVLVGALFLSFRGGPPSSALGRVTALSAREELTSLSLMKSHTHVMGGDSFDAIVINASSARSPATFPQTAAALAHSACELVPDTAKARFVQVTIQYGWDLGIARSFEVKTSRTPPACGAAAARDADSPGASSH